MSPDDDRMGHAHRNLGLAFQTGKVTLLSAPSLSFIALLRMYFLPVTRNVACEWAHLTGTLGTRDTSGTPTFLVPGSSTANVARLCYRHASPTASCSTALAVEDHLHFLSPFFQYICLFVFVFFTFFSFPLSLFLLPIPWLLLLHSSRRPLYISFYYSAPFS